MIGLNVPAPIEMMVVPPQTEVGQRELAQRVAELHADYVLHTIDRLPCPAQQKLALLQAVINAVRDASPNVVS